MNTIEGARLYRYGDTVALSIKDGQGFRTTAYIPVVMARSIASLLEKIAVEITEVPLFSESIVGSWNVEKTGADTKVWREGELGQPSMIYGVAFVD